MRVEVGTYEKPENVGFIGWVKMKTRTLFVACDGAWFVVDNTGEVVKVVR